MTDPTLPSYQRPKNRREDQVPAWVKLLSRLLLSAFGMSIAVWGIYDVAVSDRKYPPASAWHYVIMAGVILLGLGIAGGKRTIDTMKEITAGIRAWRSGGGTP
jgi:hypothetical protein